VARQRLQLDYKSRPRDDPLLDSCDSDNFLRSPGVCRRSQCYERDQSLGWTKVTAERWRTLVRVARWATMTRSSPGRLPVGCQPVWHPMF